MTNHDESNRMKIHYERLSLFLISKKEKKSHVHVNSRDQVLFQVRANKKKEGKERKILNNKKRGEKNKSQHRIRVRVSREKKRREKKKNGI